MPSSENIKKKIKPDYLPLRNCNSETTDTICLIFMLSKTNEISTFTIILKPVGGVLGALKSSYPLCTTTERIQ